LSHASSHKVPHATASSIISLAYKSNPLAGYQHQQHSVPCMNDSLHIRLMHGRNTGAATRQHASGSAESISMDTLRCKIPDVPGASVDVMTDELLNLGALSARYMSALPMPSQMPTHSSILSLTASFVHAQCGGVQASR